MRTAAEPVQSNSSKGSKAHAVMLLRCAASITLRNSNHASRSASTGPSPSGP